VAITRSHQINEHDLSAAAVASGMASPENRAALKLALANHGLLTVGESTR
jgi:hypothetical protein